MSISPGAMPAEAAGCLHLMNDDYAPEQAFWVCRTARCNPGVLVTFDASSGGRAAAVAPGGWDGEIDFYDAAANRL